MTRLGRLAGIDPSTARIPRDSHLGARPRHIIKPELHPHPHHHVNGDHATTINKNCNPFVKEKLLKGLSAKKWRTTTEIVALGGVHTNNIYANIGVLIREGVVETMMRGIPNGGNSRGCHRERVYRLTGNESVFEPTTGPAIIVIDPANHPQFYVDKVAAVLKKHYMEGKTVTVTVIEGDPSKEEEAGCE